MSTKSIPSPNPIDKQLHSGKFTECNSALAQCNLQLYLHQLEPDLIYSYTCTNFCRPSAILFFPLFEKKEKKNLFYISLELKNNCSFLKTNKLFPTCWLIGFKQQNKFTNLVLILHSRKEENLHRAPTTEVAALQVDNTEIQESQSQFCVNLRSQFVMYLNHTVRTSLSLCNFIPTKKKAQAWADLCMCQDCSVPRVRLQLTSNPAQPTCCGPSSQSQVKNKNSQNS